MANEQITELSKLKLDELRVLAKEHQVKSYMKYRKAELISILDEVMKSKDLSVDEVKESLALEEIQAKGSDALEKEEKPESVKEQTSPEKKQDADEQQNIREASPKVEETSREREAGASGRSDGRRVKYSNEFDCKGVFEILDMNN